MTVTHLRQVAQHVEDMDRAVAFYRDVVGLEPHRSIRSAGARLLRSRHQPAAPRSRRSARAALPRRRRRRRDDRAPPGGRSDHRVGASRDPRRRGRAVRSRPAEPRRCPSSATPRATWWGSQDVESSSRAEQASPHSSAPRPSDRSDGDPGFAQDVLGLGDGVLAEVEDRRGEHRVGAAHQHALDEVVERAHAARLAITGIERRVGQRAREVDVEALLGAVAVHRREQDLAGAELLGSRRPSRARRCRSACGRRG